MIKLTKKKKNRCLHEIFFPENSANNIGLLNLDYISESPVIYPFRFDPHANTSAPPLHS